MRLCLKPILYCLFGIIISQISAQELPPIQVFTPEDYNAENQNWSISQGDDKTIYVANNEGLLEYNGARWTLHHTPNNSIMRSVKVVNNKIYSGSYMDFGYWQRNEFGILYYTSLSSTANVDLIEDEQFWSIIHLDDFILFRSLNRIYIYDTRDNSFKIVNSETIIRNVSKVNGSIYFQKINDGLYKLENGKEVLISKHPIVQNNIIVNIFPSGNGLLIQTQEDGMYSYRNEQFARPENFNNEAIQNFNVYASIMLKDETFVLGTISNGVVHLSSNGQIRYKITQNEGLSNNTILSLFEDVDGNIWLGLDNGIDCLNTNSVFKIYNDDEGKLGTVYASAVFNGNLYLGTNQGLFFRKVNDLGNFTFVEGTQGQVWCLFKYQDTLFCGHNFGTYVINNNQATKVADVQGTWNLREVDGYPNLLLQGNYDGLNILEKIANTWRFRNKIEGFNISSRFFEFVNSKEIMVSHEYKGLFTIEVDAEFEKAINIKEDTNSKGSKSSLLKYKDDIFYGYSEGIFKYNKASKEFVKDTVLSQIYANDHYISGKLVADNRNDKLWAFSKEALYYITPGKLSAEPEINEIEISHAQRNTVVSYENIIPFKDETYLFGTTSGYILVDLDQNVTSKFNIQLNSISNSAINTESEVLDRLNQIEFESTFNNFEFNFSVPEFDKFLITEYQYQLEGMYDKWSDWSTSSSASFKNLPHGDYTFNVRAKVGEQVSQNVESYVFSINRPWYLSNLFLFLYAIGLVLFSFMMHTLYKNYYRKQREQLLQRTQRELELKELENQQQIMRFENEALEQDVESKSRELAISTMSLIKKNEFLNTIKEELKNTQTPQEITKVIRIIDKNINNTNDWKLFEEAFNNADKDFLKKIKSKHSSLTPNDLKLCAYLRLNLSSKEIAPLLNISPRSVEVKRYRLRKKMDLAHETSLTNYILEV